MKKDGRYDTSGLVEAQFEPGSRGRVLRNIPGEQHRLTAADICDMHRRWLGGIYAWAGTYRQVAIQAGMDRNYPPMEKSLRRDYRPEPCRDLRGAARSCRFNARAIVSGFLPVSTEVLLDTFVMSASRRLPASRR